MYWIPTPASQHGYFYSGSSLRYGSVSRWPRPPHWPRGGERPSHWTRGRVQEGVVENIDLSLARVHVSSWETVYTAEVTGLIKHTKKKLFQKSEKVNFKTSFSCMIIASIKQLFLIMKINILEHIYIFRCFYVGQNIFCEV